MDMMPNMHNSDNTSCVSARSCSYGQLQSPSQPASKDNNYFLSQSELTEWWRGWLESPAVVTQDHFFDLLSALHVCINSGVGR